MTVSQFISIALSAATIVALFVLGATPLTVFMISASIIFFIAMTVMMDRKAKAARVAVKR